MKRSDTIRLVCYAAALAFILFYPVRQIWQFKFPEGKGTEYRFRVTAQDPYDPMRGRYVWLNLNEMSSIRLKKNTRLFSFNETCLAVLKRGPNGEAKIVDLVEKRENVPAGADFLPVKYNSFFRDYDPKTRKFLKTGMHTIRLPFDRFYLNERKAPEVEKKLQKRGIKAELIVIVYPGGISRVKDLIVDGTAVRGR